jgi:hypothetical protein
MIEQFLDVENEELLPRAQDGEAQAFEIWPIC